jgi:DNA repair protein RecO (recombination protein O)
MANPSRTNPVQWQDEGLILSVRPHGETAAVVELLTRNHGRHLGLVHGGRSRRLRPVLQVGNHVDVTWKARLEERLGMFTVDLRAALSLATLDSANALAALLSIATLARELPERDPHQSLYEITLFVMGFFGDDDLWPPLYVRWELALLENLGLGLDLAQCAATGSNDHLVYVSPKSGRAVSASAGEPYRERLLALPQFLTKASTGHVGADGLKDGLALTGHFLATRVFAPRGDNLPEPRQRLVSLLQKN